MNISNLLERYKTNTNILCSDCGKKCKNKKSCLITQIVNEVNKERIGTKWKPVSYITVLRKLKGKTEYQVTTCISNCKDYKNRNGSFGKCFWGSLKNTLQEKQK
jgi:hypothetical protein